MSGMPEMTAVGGAQGRAERRAEPVAASSLPAVQRVAILLTRMGHGGKERVAWNLAIGLKRQGVDPLVVCLEESGQLLEQLEEAGVETLVVPSVWGRGVGSVIGLARALRRHRSEVLHVHDLQSLAYGCMANYLAGMKPVVMTGHGLLLGSRRKAGLRERLMGRQVRILSAVSPAAVEEYRELLEYAEEVRLIQNGVPAEELSGEERAARRGAIRRSLGISADELLVLAVGNLKPEKGYEDLLSAAAILREKAAGRRLKFRIVGLMPGDAYETGLKAQHAALGLSGYVEFLGGRVDVADLYAGADMFVMSSRKEALPMVLLEAMAARLAVVATRVGGIAAALEDGRYGLLADAAAPEELADRIAELASDGRRRDELAEAARGRLESAFSMEVMVRNYRAAYSAAVAASRVRRRKVPQVVMLGPMAPLSGGMATVMAGMGSGMLSRSCRLRLVQSGKRTAADRSVVSGVWSQVGLGLRTAWLAVSRRNCIVHIHTCSNFAFWRDSALVVLSRVLLKRVILHIHGGRFDDFLGGLSRWRRGLARLLLRCPSRVLVLTKNWQERLSAFSPGARFQVMKNGVEVRPAGPPGAVCELPEVLPDEVGRLRLLYMGNLGPRKGVRELIEALGLLGAQCGGVEAIVGGGETEAGQREVLQKRIDELGLRERVRLAGVVGGEDREAAFSTCDALVLPSHAEGLPMAILEGMSRGMPVIATRVGGIPETVDEGVTGLLVEPKDVAGLAEAIRHLALNPMVRRRMSAAARRECELHYSLEAVGAQLVGLYDSLLSGGRG